MSQVPRKTTGSKRSAPASRAWDALTPSLSEWILEAVSSLGFARLTPVQATTIPLFTKNSDVVVEAVTGSGKTLAFLIPVVERLLRLEEPIKKHHVGAIIISPTRELATQIHNVLLSLLAFHPPSAVHLQPPAESSLLGTFEGANVPPPLAPSSSTLRIVPQLLLGGTTTPSQDLAHFLNNSSNLLISTPGRLVELLSSPHVHCPQSSFEVLVMDEADRLLDLGFKEDLQKILQRLPKQRRTGLFSASMSEAVEQLVRVGLRNPVRIAVKVTGVGGGDDQRTPASLQMAYLTTPPTHKLPALISLLHHLQPTPTKTIVYLSTCASVDYFSHLLTSIVPTHSNLSIIPLHGKHPDAVRSKNFNRFITTPTPTLLLTTDLAARGLDIPSVDLTIQLDPPSDPKTFLHRAGRAGRAGRKGLAVVFLLPGRESEDYPAFLAVRKTPVTPLAEVLISTTNVPSFFHLDRTEALDITDAKAKATTHALRKTILKDRALHDKGQRGFVSWVKAYSKHTASSIFRVADVAWTEQADAWALLKLPKMPELKAYNKAHAQLQPPPEGAPAIADDKILDMEAPPPIQPTTQASPPLDTTLGLQIPWRTYAYLDPAKEAKRTAAFPLDPALPTTANARNPTFAIPPPASTTNPTVRREAWSNNTDIRSVAAGRRERKAAKRERAREGGLSAEQRAKEEEVKAMVERVRKGVLAGEADEFMGFAD